MKTNMQGKRLSAAVLLAVFIIALIPLSPHAAATGDVSAAVSASGFYSTAVMADGSLWEWGDVTQLTDFPNVVYLRPNKIMDGAVAVSSGSYHAAAIATDATLWTWGSNIFGQIGDGSRWTRANPVMVMEDVVTASAGHAFTMAVKTDGSLWTWGSNEYGQLGNGTTEHSAVPAQILDNVWSAVCGGFSGYALRTDGSLWAWGWNGSGQLGDGTNTDRFLPVKIMDGVTGVASGGGHTLAIKADGSLWAWGTNYCGQLGDGTNTDSYSPVKVMDDAASVSAGYFHSLAIKTDGSLWAWGLNDYGQLGDGTNTDSASPLKIADDVASISAGSFHSIAAKTDGSLWAWGLNSGGQLGDGTKNDSSSPVHVMNGIIRPRENEPPPLSEPLPEAPQQGGQQAALSPEEALARWEQNGFIDENRGVLIDGAIHYDNVLYALWDIYGYPDDVGGVYFDRDAGRIAFLLVGPTAERMEELRAIAGSDAVFTPCSYSWNELTRVHEEIAARMGPDSGIYSIGTGWTTINNVSTGFGDSGKEFRVVVSVNEAGFDRYRKEFAELYGDKVYVESGGMAGPEPDSQYAGAVDDAGPDDTADTGNDAVTGNTANNGETGESPGNTGRLWILIAAGICVLAVLSVFSLLLWRRKRRG